MAWAWPPSGLRPGRGIGLGVGVVEVQLAVDGVDGVVFTS